jgi:hypothetical protein
MVHRAFVHGSGLALALAVAGLGLCARTALAQQQFVVAEATYTATSANTMDSHYFVSPAAGTPSNWRSPIDYASGRAHARLEVLEKPSAAKTLYNICYEAPSNYACMGYSPAYTATGVYDFEFAFSSFYQYSAVDWSQGIKDIALILKDENGTKVQGDPAFYPSKIHITITIIAPGSTYMPPPSDKDAGAGGKAAQGGAGSAGHAGSGAAGANAAKDAAVTTPHVDAGTPAHAADAGNQVRASDAAAPARDAGMPANTASAAGTGVTGAPSAAGSGALSGPTQPPSKGGGCSTTDARPIGVFAFLGLCALASLVRRTLASRRLRGNDHRALDDSSS